MYRHDHRICFVLPLGIVAYNFTEGLRHIGYTHYWKKVNEITDEHVDFVNRIIDLYEKESGKKIVNGLGEEGTHPTVTTELISLNGEEDQGCETLYLKPGEEGLQFCKTNRRKYDAVVCAVLLYLEQQGVIEELDSDGDMDNEEEWVTAKALLDRALA